MTLLLLLLSQAIAPDGIAATAQVVLAVIAVMAVVFHAGYTWQQLDWLRKNAATKSDVIIAIDGAYAAFKGPPNKVEVEACEDRHRSDRDQDLSIERRISRLEASAMERQGRT